MVAHTITIDDETFEAVKAEADRRHMSVDQLIAESLATFTGSTRNVEPSSLASDANAPMDERGKQLRAFYALEAFAKDHPFRVDPHSYTRDELHERP